MTFAEAFEAMKRGKLVRMPGDDRIFYMIEGRTSTIMRYFGGNSINSAGEAVFGGSEICRNDWQVYWG